MLSILENYGDKTGESCKKSRKTALNHYNKFLCYLNSKDPVQHVYTDVNQIPVEEFKTYRHIFGMFPDYLRNVATIAKADSVKQYISKVKMYIEDKNPDSDIVKNIWYSTVRATTTKEYFREAKKTGKKIKDSAPTMTAQDLRYLCEVLFNANTRVDLSNRCLLVLQWQLLGRISETSELCLSDISWYPGNGYNAIIFNCSRTKVSVQHDLQIFMHSKNWITCPYHALGTYLAVETISDNNLFRLITESKEASYVNELLKRISLTAKSLADEDNGIFTEKLTSHSSRSGGASHANEHPDMNNLTWILQRGGWALDNMHNIFAYLTGSSKTDGRVARSLSDWPKVDFGGSSLTIDGIPREDVNEFYWFSEKLIASNFKREVKTSLVCTLLMYYDEVKLYFGNSILINKTENCDVDRVKLLFWGKCLKNQFKNVNGLFNENSNIIVANKSSDKEVPPDYINKIS